MKKPSFSSKIITRYFPKGRDFPIITDSLLVFILCFLVVLGVGLISKPPFQKIGSIVVQCTLALIPIMYCIAHNWDLLKIFALKKTSSAPFFSGTLLVIGLQLFSWILGTEIIERVSKYNFATTTLNELVYDSNWVLSFVILVILPCFCEEILFRGFIISGFIGQPDTKKLILCALLFSLIHLDIYRFPFVFVAGGILCWFRLRTESLFVVVWMHFVYNSIPFWVIKILNSSLQIKSVLSNQQKIGIIMVSLALMIYGFQLFIHFYQKKDYKVIP